jgi:putative peptidoglycan lipid II flippase
MQQTDDGYSRKIRNASFLLMASIFLSRVIGFFREWVIARSVGASAMTDVYYASFTIPDFLNHLMASGALSISFIPMLADYAARGKHDLGEKVFRAIGSVLGVVLIIFVLIAEVFAYDLGALIAPGFTVEQLELLKHLIRIILPAQIFFYWGGLAISVQHMQGRFLLPALAPIIYNSGIVICGVALHHVLGVTGFSIGVLVGSFVGHGLLQAFGVTRAGYSLRPLFSFDSQVRSALTRYIWLTIPITLGFSLIVSDEWISKYLASSMQPGVLSWLSFARTEMRIPVAILGQAAGVASFPFLSKLWSEGERLKYGDTLLREILKLWALGWLCMVVLSTHALPITHAIYGGGRLSAQDLAGTAHALRFFSFGVFFWTVQGVLSRGFYACQKTWLPSILGTAVSFLCIPLYAFLGNKYSHGGLAASASLGIAAYTICLWLLLRSHLKQHCPTLEYRNFWRFCAAWTFVVAAAWLACYAVLALGIYKASVASAMLDVLVVSIAVIIPAWMLLRFVFTRFTKTPLF